MKKCEVIEIISDDFKSFETRFFHIHKFVTESYIYKPHKKFFSCEGEKNAYKYFYEKNVDVRLKKIILKVSQLLSQKILDHLV